MKTLQNKTIIYDNSCPMCSIYTNAFVNHGVLKKEGRVAFEELDSTTFKQIDLNRARHEIPLIDKQTGEVLYGIDALTTVVASMLPVVRPLITAPWFKRMLRPLYKFISYNRRVIAGSFYGGIGFNCAPDFSLKWRLTLITLGMGIISFDIYMFAVIAGIANVLMLYIVLFSYFLLLLVCDITFNKTFEDKVDYLGHLVTLGVIEGFLFVSTALIAKATNLPQLLFAGQGAGRLLAAYLHAKRIENNNYSHKLNYAFAVGAVGLIVYLAYILK